MIAIATVLFAFPLGFFLRNRVSAYIAYLAIYSYTFTFQTMTLLREQLNGSKIFPANPNQTAWSYLIVTAGILAVGFLLVTLAHHLATKRRDRTASPLDLDAAH
jgi:hypothetical protein